MDPGAKRLFKGPKGTLGPEQSDFFNVPKGPLGPLGPPGGGPLVVWQLMVPKSNSVGGLEPAVTSHVQPAMEGHGLPWPALAGWTWLAGHGWSRQAQGVNAVDRFRKDSTADIENK